MRTIRPGLFLDEPVRKFQISLLMLLALIVMGSAGYMLLESMGVIDAVYMTVITISTVGFMEVTPLSPAGRLFTIVLVILGVGIGAWAIRTGVEISLGDTLWHSVRKRKMIRTINDLHGHYIVCGFGRMGQQIARDMALREQSFVVVDHNSGKLDVLREREHLHIGGDATHDETLIAAGIERAAGLVAALNSDADNVLAVLTARGLNPGLLIVARAGNDQAESKLRRAGADRVVCPYAIGGHRLALALLQPVVNDFIGTVFSGEQDDVAVNGIPVEEGSPIGNRSISAADLRGNWGLTIIGIRRRDGEFVVSPEPDRTIEVGETLIVIGHPDRISAGRKELMIAG